MRRLLLAFPLVLATFGALAEEVSAEVRKQFWCGVAFDLAARDVPEDAAPEVLAVTTPYKTGAGTLIGRARVAYLEAGYTEEAFEALRAETEARVLAELARTDPAVEPQHSFEDCAALIGL
ncbi:MAG TPA: hypothetical protein VIN06_09140 [Devosia sp.]